MDDIFGLYSLFCYTIFFYTAYHAFKQGLYYYENRKFPGTFNILVEGQRAFFGLYLTAISAILCLQNILLSSAVFSNDHEFLRRIVFGIFAMSYLFLPIFIKPQTSFFYKKLYIPFAIIFIPYTFVWILADHLPLNFQLQKNLRFGFIGLCILLIISLLIIYRKYFAEQIMRGDG